MVKIDFQREEVILYMKNINIKYKKFKNCSLPYPFYDKKRDSFEWVSCFKATNYYNIRNNLLDALADNTNYGVIYHYKVGMTKKGQNLSLMVPHGHTFDEVIRALYDYPESFEVPDEFADEYSKQELNFLKQTKNYLLLIGLKDLKKSREKDLLDKKWDEIYSKKHKCLKDRLFLLSYQRRWEKLTEKEYFKRYENSKASEYALYYPNWFKNDDVVNGIMSGVKDYLIYIQYSFSSSRLHDKFLLIDSNYKYVGAIEIISEDIIPFKDLKANMVNYKLSGFKTFTEYKNYLLNEFVEDSKYYSEPFTEDSFIKYAKIKVIKKFF